VLILSGGFPEAGERIRDGTSLLVDLVQIFSKLRFHSFDYLILAVGSETITAGLDTWLSMPST
jgi:hypothetical protein